MDTLKKMEISILYLIIKQIMYLMVILKAIVEKYKTQIDYYTRALEKTLGKKS